MSERMRRGHAHWFINHDDSGTLDRERPVRCACGESFGGFVAWADHGSGRDLANASGGSKPETAKGEK